MTKQCIDASDHYYYMSECNTCSLLSIQLVPTGVQRNGFVSQNLLSHVQGRDHIQRGGCCRRGCGPAIRPPRICSAASDTSKLWTRKHLVPLYLSPPQVSEIASLCFVVTVDGFKCAIDLLTSLRAHEKDL